MRWRYNMSLYMDNGGNLFSQDDLENLTDVESKNSRFQIYH